MQMRARAKTATPDLASGWKSIAGEIYHWNSAWTPTWNSAQTTKAKDVNDKKARVENIVYQ